MGGGETMPRKAPPTPAQITAAFRAVHLLGTIIAEGHVLFLTDEGELPPLIQAMRDAGISYREMPAVEGEP